MNSIENDFFDWLDNHSDTEISWTDSGKNSITLFLNGEDVKITVPPKYPNTNGDCECYKFLGETKRMKCWSNAVNKAIADKIKSEDLTKVRIGKVLDIALGIDFNIKDTEKKTEMEVEEGDNSEPVSMKDFNDDNDDEDDDDNDIFTEFDDEDAIMVTSEEEDPNITKELDRLKLKKIWKAKEDKMREDKRLNEAKFNTMGSNSKKQIFSSDAAFAILSNEYFDIQDREKELGFTVSVVDDNIYNWNVKMYKFNDEGATIEKTLNGPIMQNFGYNYVELSINFTLDLYPFYPPSVKVLRPRFTGNIMNKVTSMKRLKLSFWDFTQNMSSILIAVKQVLEEEGVIDVDSQYNDAKKYPSGAYSTLDYALLQLSVLTDITDGRYADATSTSISTHTVTTTTSSSSSTQNSNGNNYWAAGTGYGHGSVSSGKKWDPEAHKAAELQKDKELGEVFKTIAKELNEHTPEDVNFEYLNTSCLVPVLESYIRNDSIFDQVQHIALYEYMVDVLEALAARDEWVGIFLERSNASKNLFELFKALNKQASVLLASAKKFGDSSSSSSSSSDKSENDICIDFARKLSELYKRVEPRIANLKDSGSTSQSDAATGAVTETTATDNTDSDVDAEALYAEAMADIQFDVTEIDLKTHVYGETSTQGSPQAKYQRLAQEQATLCTSLPATRDSTVFVRIDEEQMDFMRVLITGPSAADFGRTSTPYACGCFAFDVFFPPSYPNVPPKVTLVTTGNGTVRFNPNLYKNGKVCLSLLGTWSGSSEENWNAKTSTLLQVLISIQSLILVPEPYFNEPGYEKSIGTPQGIAYSRSYNKVIREETMRHAILGQLRNPSPGFEDAIRLHFFLLQNRVVEQCSRWAEEDKSTVMESLLKEIKTELKKLSFPSYDPLPV